LCVCSVSDIAALGSDYHDPFSSPKKGARGKFRLHYEYVFWTIFGLLTAYTILDRFYVNLFPMSINFKPLVRGASRSCCLLVSFLSRLCFCRLASATCLA
jgi:hypothetical protein